MAQNLQMHLRNVESGGQKQIEGIDAIYLINLDERPEKLDRMRQEFEPWGLSFIRVPAIYGWHLPREAFDDLGVKFTPGMKKREESRSICYNGTIMVNPLTTAHPDRGEYLPLDESFYGKNCFSVSMKAGAIGCTLSHLSILQEAIVANHQVIWVVEDDVKICEDPHQFSKWLETAPLGWDILYTDCVTYFHGEKDIEWIWRPDLSIDYEKLIKTVHCGDFLKIGGRGQTHSMIISRSGMEKIFSFYTKQGMFLPYDMELSIIPDIQLYNFKQNLVIQNHTISDTVRKNFE